MPDTSALLGLPYLLPSQAQKHVTHNAALRLLDLLVQTGFDGIDSETPPAVPAEGETHALGAAPTGDWAGQASRIATFGDGAWMFLDPQTGWRAWDKAAALLRVWDGGAWVAVQKDQVDQLGVNASADATNRLTVSAAATLLTNAGAGHQLKINKAGSTDTASLLFQSGWSGHAEMGLAGDTDFSIKVSPDGGTWAEALRFDAASGLASGAAIQSDQTDAGAGKLMTTGAFGLGTTTGTPTLVDLDDDDTPSGFWAITGSTSGTRPADFGSGFGFCLVTRAASTPATQTAWVNGATAAPRIWHRRAAGGSWGAWVEMVLTDSTGKATVTALATDQGANTPALEVAATHASFNKSALDLRTQRTAAAAFDFATFAADDGADVVFRFSGDGTGSCDGAWSGGGADYAEWFEWADGNPDGEDRRGRAVVLNGAQIRLAEVGETPIGIISAAPSVVGDGDAGSWKGKYLRDVFGAYLREDGKRIPNPDFDAEAEYLPRAVRPEWAMVGLMGKLRLRKGEPVAPRWMLMREIADGIEEWLVR